MFKTARTMTGAAALTAALFAFGGITAHASGFSDVRTCEQAIRADLETEYGTFKAAATALGMKQNVLRAEIEAICVAEVLGAQDAAVQKSNQDKLAR